MASFLGSPLAGVVGAVLIWQSVFVTSTAVLAFMGIVFFSICCLFEKKGIVKYNQYDHPKGEGGGIKILIKHRIIRFTLISVITGVIRTTVVFWLPTYISQYLGFSADKSAMIFTVASFGIATSAFIAIFLYERLRRNMDLTLLISFVAATVFFLVTYFVKQPVINIVALVLAIIGGDSAATMLWSRYCPSLRDTGMVSGATGFLDFMSYMAAALSSTLFANSVSAIGWGNLILIWAGLMAIGVIISINPERLKNK